MKRVNINNITVNWECDDCKAKQEDVPVIESIYDGPPICLNCGEEMSLNEVFINES